MGKHGVDRTVHIYRTQRTSELRGGDHAQSRLRDRRGFLRSLARPAGSTPVLRRPCESDAVTRVHRLRRCLLCVRQVSADSVEVHEGRLSRCTPYARVAFEPVAVFPSRKVQKSSLAPKRVPSPRRRSAASHSARAGGTRWSRPTTIRRRWTRTRSTLETRARMTWRGCARANEPNLPERNSQR